MQHPINEGKTLHLRRLIIFFSLFLFSCGSNIIDKHQETPEQSISVDLIASETQSVTTTPYATPAISRYNPSFIFGTDCSTPCWMGIVPGKSTLKNVIMTLPDIRKLNYNATNLETIAQYFYRFPNRVGVLIFIDNDVVKTISFDNLVFSIGEIINIIGVPTWIKIVEYRDDHGNYINFAILYYPQIGVRVSGWEESEDNVINGEVNVNSEMRVIKISLHEPVQPDDYRNIREHWVIPQDLPLIEDELELFSWNGYKIYRNK